MNMIFKAAALASLSLSAVAVVTAVPVAAQSKTGAAVASMDAAVARSTAFTNAMTQIQTTYKAQIDARNARAQTLQAEMNALGAKFNEEQGRNPQNRPALEAAARAFQDKRTAAQTELETLGQPINLAMAYAEEQVNLRINDAVKAAMTKRKVDLLLNAEAVLARENNVDITDAIVAELNVLVPAVQITPPAGYRPGQLLQAQQRPATPGQQPAPASQPQTR